MSRLTPGLVGEVEIAVTQADTAARWGSGRVPVLGTPVLVALMERAAVEALVGHLPAGQTSVGSRIDVRHLSPTPVDMRVRARAELLEVAGRRLTFRIEAWDEDERIGEATHERFLVNIERFIAKARSKVNQQRPETA